MILPTPLTICLTSDAPAADVTDILRQWAAVSRNPHVARAAQALERPKGGRPQLDDRLALDQIAALLDTGAAAEIEIAARMVAISRPGGHSIPSTTRRLARKFRKQNNPDKTS